MTTREQAKIILDKLDSVMGINWNFEQTYLSAIEDGLKEIQRKEPPHRPKLGDSEIKITIKL